MNLENQIHPSLAAKFRTALVFGALAGLAFSIVTWGLDSFPLVPSHAVLPLLPFTLGSIFCVIIGALAGWLTYRFNHMLANFVIWLGTGLLFSLISSHMLFDIQSAALRWFAPDWAARVNYPFNSSVQGHSILVFLVVTTILCIAGLLSTHFFENAAEAGTPVGRIFYLLIWITFFVLAGLAPKNNLSELLLGPVTDTNRLIQFAIDHEGQTVDSTLASQVHLRAVDSIQDLIHRPRRLILSGYDDALSNMRVLVNFSDTWVECSVVDNLVNFCEKK